MGSYPSKNHSRSGLEIRNQFIFSYVIGKGGFGKVSSVMHIESKEWCAMKEMSISQLMKHRSGMAMLMAEISAHKRLDSHQFIANMKSAFHDNQICYMSFDLCVGGDLRYHLRKGHRFDEESAAFILACIGSALHYIHGKGIIHRDVKPENILLDDYGFAILTDFGASHVSPMDSPEDYCFKSSGTRQYLAPEVFTKSHKHTYSADFWSLGIVLYELIHGVRPFEKHCPTSFIHYLEGKSQSKGGRPYQEIHDDFCASDKYPFSCTCRSLSECCVTNREGVPCVYLPEISRINGIISQSCLRILAGLLQVEPTSRFGHGAVNYINLSNDSWFEENQMAWNEIVEGEVVPPYTPDLREVSVDICKRYVCDSSMDTPSEHCTCHDESCLSCRPLPIPTEVRNALDEFYFVTAEYEKYAIVIDIIPQSSSQSVPFLSKKLSNPRVPLQRSSSQVHVST